MCLEQIRLLFPAAKKNFFKILFIVLLQSMGCCYIERTPAVFTTRPFIFVQLSTIQTSRLETFKAAGSCLAVAKFPNPTQLQKQHNPNKEKSNKSDITFH
jgi:hypothetical protein